MFRMTPHGHRFSNGGLTDSHLPLDVPGGSPDLGYLRRVRLSHNPPTRVKSPVSACAIAVEFEGSR